MVLSLVSGMVKAQDFKKQFSEALEKNDTITQRVCLEKWQARNPGAADLYIAWFNYYSALSRSEMLQIGHNSKDASLQLTDSSGNVGYLSATPEYDEKILARGFQYIEKGIGKYPDRLDMRFGKVYMYGQSANFEKFTKEIIRTIHYGASSGNKWKWLDGKPLVKPKDFMLKTIQSYFIQLYDTGDDALAPNMKAIAQAVLQHYPNHVESLSNLAITYSIEKDWGNALKALLKAESISPDDFIVLNNIAAVYEKKGDIKNAIKYYERTLARGDEEARQQAAEKLELLRKKR